MELRIPMQPPTVRPWPWPGWDARGDLLDRYQQRRRFRLTLHDLAELRNMQDATRGLKLDWSHLPKQEIAVYVPKNLRHLIRFDSSSPGLSPGLTYGAGSWPPSPGPTKRTGTNGFNIFSFNHDFSMPDLKHLRLEPIPVAGGAELQRGWGRHWEDAARAWAGAALIVVAFVLFVRAIEKCIHSKFFKPRSRRRRTSSEWETPTVFATSYQNASDQAPIDPPPRMQDSEVFPSEGQENQSGNDLPPPYSECANTADDANKFIGSEEPPPPYSACYVAYSNPKDGLPSVHFLNRRREDIFQNRLEAGQSSSTPDVSLRDAENAAKSKSGCDDSKSELVFENGRVIERDGTVNSESNARDTRNEEYVVNISEPGSTNVPDRTLQV